MAIQKDRYIPHFDPVKLKDASGKPVESVAVDKLQEEFRKLWESVHQIHGKLNKIELLNDLKVNGGIESTGDITADSSVVISNYLQFLQRNFDKSGVLNPAVAPKNTARIYFDKLSQKLKASENLGAYGNLFNTLPAACVFSSVDQSTANNAFTTLAFDSTSFDDASYHSNSVNNSRLTIPTTGRYFIWAVAAFAANAIGERLGRFRLGGASSTGLTTGLANTTFNQGLSWSVHVNLSAGNYVEVQTDQTSGGALNVLGTTQYTLFGIIQTNTF